MFTFPFAEHSSLHADTSETIVYLSEHIIKRSKWIDTLFVDFNSDFLCHVFKRIGAIWFTGPLACSSTVGLLVHAVANYREDNSQINRIHLLQLVNYLPYGCHTCTGEHALRVQL